MAIIIKNDERVALVGATGTGKTELSRRLLKGLERVLVLDPKWDFRMEDFKIGWRLPVFRDDFKLIIRPGEEDDEKMVRLLRAVMREGYLTVYIDELATLAEEFPYTTSILAGMARTGRERRISLWSAMQRPRNVPRVFLTETEVFFIFTLRGQEDREYMRGFAGDEVMERLPKFQFWYTRAGEDVPELLTLDLKTGKVYHIEAKESPGEVSE